MVQMSSMYRSGSSRDSGMRSRLNMAFMINQPRMNPPTNSIPNIPCDKDRKKSPYTAIGQDY